VHVAFKKEFLRTTGQVEARLDISTYREIIKSAYQVEGLLGSHHQNVMMHFPGPISETRAYIASLMMTARNDSNVGGAHVISGLSRYGLDSPMPSVATRLAYYGNPITIREALADAAAKYNADKSEGAFNIDLKKFSGN